jgi:hypothetical protein
LTVDMSPAAIDARLREASRLAGSLRPEDRLETKISLTGAAISARLKEASDLLDLCRVLARAGAASAR